jgi:hypothetical protein
MQKPDASSLLDQEHVTKPGATASRSASQSTVCIRFRQGKFGAPCRLHGLPQPTVHSSAGPVPGGSWMAAACRDLIQPHGPQWQVQFKKSKSRWDIKLFRWVVTEVVITKRQKNVHSAQQTELKSHSEKAGFNSVLRLILCQVLMIHLHAYTPE